MTKKEIDAKINEFMAELDEMKKHRTPSNEIDNLAVESTSITQGDRAKQGSLKVLNSQDAVTSLSDASVKVSHGGFKEVNGKKSKDSEVR